jgi:hypothetical protein
VYAEYYSMSLAKYASKSQSIVDIGLPDLASAHYMKHKFHFHSKLCTVKMQKDYLEAQPEILER